MQEYRSYGNAHNSRREDGGTRPSIVPLTGAESGGAPGETPQGASACPRVRSALHDLATLTIARALVLLSRVNSNGCRVLSSESGNAPDRARPHCSVRSTRTGRAERVNRDVGFCRRLRHLGRAHADALLSLPGMIRHARLQNLNARAARVRRRVTGREGLNRALVHGSILLAVGWERLRLAGWCR